MGTKRPMSPSSSCPIEPHPSHHPFILSCTTTNLVFTPSPMQTMHLLLVPPCILTNHTPPISSPYQPLVLQLNAKPQPYIFPNSLYHAHVKPFPPSTLPTPLVTHDQTPNLPLSHQHVCNLHLKFLSPPVGATLLSKG
jgi:hypothetical protein